MSTSSEIPRLVVQPHVVSFEYPVARASRSDRDKDKGTNGESMHEQLLRRARQEGEREGATQARNALEESIRTARSRIQTALAEFTVEKAKYFRQVEEEVVQLALAIARKVLHREAQVDQSLLAAMVRSSLLELADTSGAVVKVHPARVEEWQSFFATSGLDPLPKIVANPACAPEECTLETSRGTTEIGVDRKLKEIEVGLFDLMSHKPEARGHE